MGPFYSLLVAIYKHAKTESTPPQPASQMVEFHLPCNLAGAQFSPKKEKKKCGSDIVKQCVLTIHLCVTGMPCRKSSQLEDLLMYCDSCCQQFSSILSSCNFQPSSLRSFHSKKACSLSVTPKLWGLLTVCTGFDVVSLDESKEEHFQDTCVARLH